MLPTDNLTENFKKSELRVSDAEDRIVQSAIFICATLLEPIRAQFKTPLIITSGYRPPEHNAAVGGEPDSFHLYEGTKAAADFATPEAPIEDVFAWLCRESNLPFDKAILEATTMGKPVVLHLQIDRGAAPRRQAFTGQTHGYDATAGKRRTVYIPEEVL
jgi:Peptidase M15